MIELEAALAALSAEYAAELKHRDLLIEKLRVQIPRMRRAGFGASSEKLAQLVLALEELEIAEAEASRQAAAALEAERPSPVRALPPSLPRVAHVIVPGACACPDCGGVLRRLGEDVAEQLDIVPVAWRVVAHVRPKYSCVPVSASSRRPPRCAQSRAAARPSRRSRMWLSANSITTYRSTARPR